MRRSSPAAAPLSGVRSPSAVSWQARVERPSLRPQPSLSASLQSLPLTKIACPSRGRLLPRRRPPVRSWRAARDRSPRDFADAGALAPWPGSLVGLRAPFPPRRRVRRPGIPVTLIAPGEAVTPRRASSTSKPCSLRESVRVGGVFPAPTAAALLGFCPSRASPLDASAPRTYPDRGAGCATGAPGGSSRTRPVRPARPRGPCDPRAR